MAHWDRCGEPRDIEHCERSKDQRGEQTRDFGQPPRNPRCPGASNTIPRASAGSSTSRPGGPSPEQLARSGDVTRNNHKGHKNSRASCPSPEARARMDAYILSFFEEGPHTADEVIVLSGLGHQSVSPRCSELKEHGYLRETGETRRTRTGSPAAVLELVRRGQGGAS